MINANAQISKMHVVRSKQSNKVIEEGIYSSYYQLLHANLLKTILEDLVIELSKMFDFFPMQYGVLNTTGLEQHRFY